MNDKHACVVVVCAGGWQGTFCDRKGAMWAYCLLINLAPEIIRITTPIQPQQPRSPLVSHHSHYTFPTLAMSMEVLEPPHELGHARTN